MVEHGNIAGVGQEGAVCLAGAKWRSVYREGVSDAAGRAELGTHTARQHSGPISGIQRSHILIAELRESHGATVEVPAPEHKRTVPSDTADPRESAQ